MPINLSASAPPIELHSVNETQINLADTLESNPDKVSQKSVSEDHSSVFLESSDSILDAKDGDAGLVDCMGTQVEEHLIPDHEHVMMDLRARV